MKSKMVLTLSGLILFAVSNIRAQDFRFGILTGFNITSTYISEYTIDNFKYEGDQLDPMAAFNINGVFEYKSPFFLGFSVEPGFIRKGGLNHIDYEGKFQFNYIELPILIDFYISKRLFVSAGPGISYLVKEKYKHKSNSFDIPVSGNKTEISGLIGINYNIIKNIDIGLRYNQGRASYTKKVLLDSGATLFSVDTKEIHHSFQLLVRFKI
ncbi:MAG: PorT family protein [Bacteroidales bacterium]|nr:PorT family protein [Bacteroidales bacterium]